MKQATSKLFQALLALVLVVFGLLPFLNTDSKVGAAELTGYPLTTRFLINNNPVQNNAKYGEGKFYIEPTYTIPDGATIADGDTLVYQVPAQLKVEQSPETDIFAPDGVTKIAKLTVSSANNTATITITNANYFANLNENRQIKALFTSVWADSVKLNTPTTMTIPGAGDYTLTRIVPDDDPTGYTK